VPSAKECSTGAHPLVAIKLLHLTYALSLTELAEPRQASGIHLCANTRARVTHDASSVEACSVLRHGHAGPCSQRAADTREAGAEAGHAPPVGARFRALGLQQRAAASPRRVSACPAVAVSITRPAERGRVRTWLSGRAARRPPGPPSRLSSALLLNCVTLRTASAHRSNQWRGCATRLVAPSAPAKEQPQQEAGQAHGQRYHDINRPHAHWRALLLRANSASEWVHNLGVRHRIKPAAWQFQRAQAVLHLRQGPLCEQPALLVCSVVSVCDPKGPHSLHVYHVLRAICLGISPERVLEIVVLVQRGTE